MFIFAVWLQIAYGKESLRLYLLNIQAKVLILGNGGLKRTATYEEDENLHRHVRVLQKIDIEIKQREKTKVIVVRGGQSCWASCHLR